MQAVAQIPRPVAAHKTVRRRLDVNAVASRDDVVASQGKAGGVPEMNAGSDFAGRPAGHAFDDAAVDSGPVSRAKVDAKQRPNNSAVRDMHTRRRDVNACRIASEIAAALPVNFDAH